MHLKYLLKRKDIQYSFIKAKYKVFQKGKNKSLSTYTFWQ